MSHHVNPGPNATYASTTTQLIVSPALGQVVTFNTIEVERGIVLQTSGGIGSQIMVKQPGDYLVSFSAICNTTTGSNKAMAMWFRKNGTDIANSNTTLRITSNNPQVMAVTFIYTLAANDYIELAMSGETTNCEILAVPAIVAPSTPVSPATPSIVLTMVQVS